MTPIPSWQQRLIKGLADKALLEHKDAFINYLNLLDKWNQAFNLSAIRNLDEMVERHIFDSLAILPSLKGPRVIDIGTGAGLPGIPIAIIQPTWQVTLLDSNGKKTRFLTELKRQLKLSKLEIVNERVENYHPTQGFDTVTSRAFSDLSKFLHLTKHLIAPQGQWLAMKGSKVTEELSNIHQAHQLMSYTLDGVDGERFCVIIPNQN